MFDEVNDRRPNRIVGGRPSPIGRWPWQGVLQYGQTIGGCGAVLLDPHWGITAAHCLQPYVLTKPYIFVAKFAPLGGISIL